MTGRAPEGGRDVSASDEDAGDDLPREYAPVQSVDTGAVALLAAGDSRLALASVSGGVSVLAPEFDDGAQFAVEGRPRGLAVGSLVFVAVDDHVFGYGFDGSRRWATALDGVTALCWVPGPSRVVAATDTGEFVLLDAADGSERGRLERTHADVSEDVLLAGRDDEFIAGESWYLTGFAPDGDRRGEAMLDGTITGVGLLEDVAVVSLHGDRVVGVDADDGTTRWERHVGVEWLAPRGDGGLYAAADHGLVRISADGEVTDVGVAATDSARMAITTDGELACRADGRTVEVLRPSESLAGVDLDLSPSSLRIDEQLTVAVENHGGATTGPVRLSGEGASFRPESRHVSLAAGERAELRFTLAEATDSEVTARAAFDPETAGGDPVEARATLSVPASTPVVDAGAVAIEEGAATVEATVRMPDGSDLPAVSLSPGDVGIDPEPGRSSVSRTVSLPLGTDRLTATTGDGESVDTTLSLPSNPLSVSVEGRDDGFVDVTIEHDAELPVDDGVRVTGDLLPAPIERPVSLHPGERLTLALPSARAGTGEVQVDAAAVEATATVTLDRAAIPSVGETDPTTAGRGDSPHSGRETARDTGVHTPEHTARDTSSTAPSDRESVAADPHADPDPNRASTGSRPDEDRAAGSPEASGGPSTASDDSPTASSDAVTGSTDGDDTQRHRRDSGPGRRAERREEPSDDTRSTRSDADPEAGSRTDADAADTPSPGTASHSSDTPEPSTSGPPEPAATPADPGQDGSSPESSESPDSPASTADSDGPVASDEVEPSSQEPIELARDLESDAAHEGQALEETLTVENPSSEPQSVTIRSAGEEATVDLRPEESATVTRYHAGWDASSIEVPAVTARADGFEATVPSVSIPVESAPVVVRPALSARSDTTDVRLEVHNNLDTSCSVLEIGSKGFTSGVSFDGFEVEPGGEDSRGTTYQGTPVERPALTFVRIDRRQRPLQTLAAVHDSTAPPVSVAVESVDALGDRDTNVVLRVRNDGSTPLDIRIEATGTAPDEYLYSPGALDGLEPGATVTHRVECTVDDERIELPIDLEATPVDGGDDAHSTTVTVSGDRTADAGTWQVDAEDEAPALPATLSTPLNVRSGE